MKSLRMSLAGSMGLVLVASVGLAALRSASETWAGGLFLATLAVSASSILGVASRRGGARLPWLGFALFAWGYLALALVPWSDPDEESPRLLTTRLIDQLYPLWHEPNPPGSPATPLDRWRAGSSPLTDRIHATLELPISMPFPKGISLKDLVQHIQSATVSPSLPHGIPIYVDPVGLEEAKKTMKSEVHPSGAGLPLKWSLAQLLRREDLMYTVKDGLLTITSSNALAKDRVRAFHAFRRTSHCFLALVAGLLGASVGRAFASQAGRGG